MAASAAVSARLARGGLLQMSPASGLEAVERLLLSGAGGGLGRVSFSSAAAASAAAKGGGLSPSSSSSFSSSSPVVAVGSFEWGKLLGGGGRAREPLFAELLTSSSDGRGARHSRREPSPATNKAKSSVAASAASLARRPSPSPPRSKEKLASILAEMSEIVASVLGDASSSSSTSASSSVPADAPLMASGLLDSLGAVELRNAVGRRFGVRLPATAAIDHPTLRALAAEVERMMARSAEEEVVVVAEEEEEVNDESGGEEEEEEKPLSIPAPVPLSLSPHSSSSFSSAASSAPIAITASWSLFPAAPQRGKSSFSSLSSSSSTFSSSSSLSTSKFFSSLASGADTASPVPFDRWDADGLVDVIDDGRSGASSSSTSWYSPEGRPHTSYVRLGSFLSSEDETSSSSPSSSGGDRLAAFDSSAFRISPADAAAMDPQARLLLEGVLEATRADEERQRRRGRRGLSSSSSSVGTVCGGSLGGGGFVETFENVEYVDSSSSSSSSPSAPNTGVFVGCMYSEYLDSVLRPLGWADGAAAAITGHGLSFLAGRVSFAFAFGGPCVATDVACSSSLVAAHLAARELRSGGGGRNGLSSGDSSTTFCGSPGNTSSSSSSSSSSCYRAVVGGVNAQLERGTTARICLLQALSPQGRCSSFDASADGYGRGDGFAVVVLRTMVMMEGEGEVGGGDSTATTTAATPETPRASSPGG